MALEVYHLQLSQSERIVWLLEELKLPYELKIFKRDSISALAPESLKSSTPTGTAPYFRDTSVSPPVGISESGAIVEYILSVYGDKAPGNRMSRVPGDPDYAAYLNWFHYANSTLQASIMRQFSIAGVGQMGSPMGKRSGDRFARHVKLIDDHLSTNKWLAGSECTAADVMTVFSLTTMRGFYPINLEASMNIRRYLNDVADRPAYREALRKGDDGMEPMIHPKTKKFTHFEALRPLLEKSTDGV